MSQFKVEWHTSVKLTKNSKTWLNLACEVAAQDLPTKVDVALLSINICGDARMKSLNKLHRGKDKTTDVLSFPAQGNLRKEKNLDWASPGVLPLGDLVISLPQASRQAKEFSVSLEEELVHLFFHGFLHLCGYDHEISLKEEKLMEKEEARLLEKFAKKRRPRK